MKSNYGMVSAAALIIGLSGCSAKNKVAETIVTETPIEKIVVAEPEPIIKTKDVLYKSAKVKSATSTIPEWYKKLPKEENIIYTVGSATSPNLQLAVDMATLNAKYTLADRINGKLDAMMKTFTSKIGSDDIDSSVLSEVEKVSKNVIASVDVAGYNPKEIEVYPSGTQYRAFVLLEYSDEEARKIIVNRLRKDQMVYSKIKSTNAWKELESEVESSKSEEQAQSLSNIENELNNIVKDKS